MEPKKERKGCLIVSMLLIGLFVGMFLCGGVGLLIGLVGGASLSDYSETVLSEGGDKKVVVIDVKGEITNEEGYGGLFSSEIASAPVITSQIQAAMDDEDVVGIILEMDTPGGDVVASDLIYKKVLEAKSSGLQVVTLMRTLAASGGYYVAVASDSIIANEMTTTGSIGVYSVFQDVSGLYEKIGIKQRVIKSGDYKTGDGLFDADDNGVEDQIYQDLVTEAHDQFKTIVSENRGISMEDLKDIADGRIFSGKQALANGLIDKLGEFNDAVGEVEKLSGESGLTIVRYDSSDFWGSVLSILKNTNLESKLLEIAKAEQGAKLMYKLQ